MLHTRTHACTHTHTHTHTHAHAHTHTHTHTHAHARTHTHTHTHTHTRVTVSVRDSDCRVHQFKIVNYWSFPGTWSQPDLSATAPYWTTYDWRPALASSPSPCPRAGCCCWMTAVSIPLFSPSNPSQSERCSEYSARKARRVAAPFLHHKLKHNNKARDMWIQSKTFQMGNGTRSLMTRDASCNQMKQITFWNRTQNNHPTNKNTAT